MLRSKPSSSLNKIMYEEWGPELYRVHMPKVKQRMPLALEVCYLLYPGPSVHFLLNLTTDACSSTGTWCMSPLPGSQCVLPLPGTQCM